MKKFLATSCAAVLLALSFNLSPVATGQAEAQVSVATDCTQQTLVPGYGAGTLIVTVQGDLCVKGISVAGGIATEATQLLVLGQLQTIAGGLANPVVLGAGSASIGHIDGPAASGASLSGNPLQDGGRASTTVPTPVTDGQAVAARLSKLGNLVTSTWAPRDLQGDNGGYTATATTSAVDCVTAGASGIFRDIVSITVNNSSASDTVVQILDTDGTTVRWTGTAKANDMRGITFPQPLKEVGAAASWKCKTVTSVSSVVFTIQYFETK